MNTSASMLILIAFLMVGGEPSANLPTLVDNQQSYTECLEKYRSAWGEDCSQCAAWKDSYVVYLKNTCTESVDVMICVQEENKTWRRFHHLGMAPGDSLRAYACTGTGKYLTWAKRAGDESVTFPSIGQVNKLYPE